MTRRSQNSVADKPQRRSGLNSILIRSLFPARTHRLNCPTRWPSISGPTVQYELPDPRSLRPQADLENKTAIEATAYEEAQRAARIEARWYRSADTYEHVARQSPRGTTSLAILLALASGGLAAVCVGRPTKTLNSLRQVRHLLSLPVLAVLLADDDAPVGPPAGRFSRAARYARLAAEVSIVVFVVATIVCFSADASFASDLASEPLASLGGSIERTWSLVGR